MSQYPSPYSSPPPQGAAPYQNAYGDPRAPGRRAGILMIVLGSIGLLCGLCTLPLFMNNSSFMAQQPPELRSMMEQSGSAALRWGVCLLAGASLLNLIFGILALRGSKAGAIGGSVLGGLGIAYFLLDALVGATIAASGNAVGLVLVGMSAVAITVFIFQLKWSIGAAKASSRITQMGAAYQAQYWQYLQQQQMYQQAYNQNPYSAPAAGGQPAGNQGWQWPAAPGAAAGEPLPLTPPPAAQSQPQPQPQVQSPPLPPPPPTDGGPHGQAPQ